MNFTRFNRRQFLVTAVAGFSAAACSSIPTPKLGDGPPRVPVKSAIRMGPAPIKGADAKFAFIKISGAPSRRIIGFEKAIETEARLRNLNIVPEGDPSATYFVKGYLSAIGDSSGTLLVYVWDVTDVSGRRLHRVSGQEPAGGSSNDPWGGVSDDEIETAAKRTVDDLVAWIS